MNKSFKQNTSLSGVKLFQIALVFLSIPLISSCKNKAQNNQEEVSVVTPISNNEITQELDSLLIQKTIVNHLTVVDNHLTFSLTKDELIQLGLPASIYDRIIDDLNQVNKMIDSTGIDNMEEILEESYKELYEIFGSPKKR